MPPLTDYPDSFGGHRAAVFAHTGPASYTQMTVGPLAGGDTVDNQEAGVKFFDFVVGGLSDSGNFRVDAVAPVGNPSDAKPGAQASSYRLQWTSMVTATVGGQAQTRGAQAAATTDLSGEIVRLFALARY